MKAMLTAKIETNVVSGKIGTSSFKKFGVSVMKSSAGNNKNSFFGIIVFGRQAEHEYRKGDKVSVDGVLTVEPFQVNPEKDTVMTALISSRYITIADSAAHEYAKAYNVLGNLTRDAELKSLSEGKMVASTDLACDDKSSGEKLTSYVKLALFNKQATGLHPYLLKGKQVLVDGALSATYFDKKGDAGKGLDVTILVDDFKFTGSRNNASNDSKHNAQIPGEPDDLPSIDVDDENDEIPF